ncbi:MAG: NAD-dependent epimerase/dehydratase family protein [Thermoplasmata archaeon]
MVSKVSVTGCAGFIGSHLVDALLARGVEVVGIDNFSSGSMRNLVSARESENFTLVEGDILSEEDLGEAFEDVDAVYHLAANPDVRAGVKDTQTHLNQNVLGTVNVLEMMRKKNIKMISFTSTSTVYGEASVLPTPEDYGPLVPISLYGASKLACEALISAYCHTFDMKSLIFRFANVVGGRSGHGVIHDFISKLRKDQNQLEILGVPPGTLKSYMYVSDCVKAILHVEKTCSERVGIYNIGSKDVIDVKSIADIVCREMGLKNVKYIWSGGVDGGRGWLGDVRKMHLSIEKMASEGWTPRMNSLESVRAAVRDLLNEKSG